MLWGLVFIVLFVAFERIVSESLFDFDVVDIEGNTVSLSKYQEAKAILIVNVASNCGYTHTNYKELRELYDAYHDAGLEILAFPSNQFAQEPDTNEKILSFCNKYGVTFPLFSKITINGAAAHPVYKYLKKKTGGTEVRWNFVKFLVVKGEPVERFQNTVNPTALIDSIIPYLDGGAAGKSEEL